MRKKNLSLKKIVYPLQSAYGSCSLNPLELSGVFSLSFGALRFVTMSNAHLFLHTHPWIKYSIHLTAFVLVNKPISFFGDKHCIQSLLLTNTFLFTAEWYCEECSSRSVQYTEESTEKNVNSRCKPRKVVEMWSWFMFEKWAGPSNKSHSQNKCGRRHLIILMFLYTNESACFLNQFCDGHA